MDELFTEFNILVDIQHELCKGFEAYHNACVVVSYYNRYGYTEHFRELIGEESLIDHAKNVIRKFIAWLKERITAFITYVKRVFHKITNYVESACQALSINELLRKENPYLLLTVPFNIYTSIDTIIILLREILPVRITTDEPYEAFTQSMVSVVNEVRSIILERSKQTVPQKEVRQYGYRLSDIVGGLQSRADTLTRELKKLKSRLHDHATMSDIINDIQQAFVGCNNGKLQLVSIDTVTITESTIPLIFQKLSYVPVFVTELSAVVAEQLRELSRVYNEHDVQIELKIPFDKGLLNRLSVFFGGSLEVQHLVVTNIDPKTWPLAGIRTLLPTYGWCYPGTQRTGAVDLWMNVRLMMFKPLFKAREDEFLKTIVHECCHLYDSQHGLPFEIVDPHQDYQKYRNSSSEGRAFAAEKNYPYTEADRIWIRDVFRQVEQLFHR